MNWKFYGSLALIFLFILGCSKESNLQIEKDTAQPQAFEFPSLLAGIHVDFPDVDYKKEPMDDLRGPTINVSPGTDQLQAIIDGAGNGTVIKLLAGTHTENDIVVVDHPIKLVGESGAILSLNGAFGLYIAGADHVQVKDLEIQNAGGAIIGLAIDHSDHLTVHGNSITGFSLSVVLEQANHGKITDNTIVGTGNLDVDLGVTIVNGDNANVNGNDISQNAFGIWACDYNGIAANNQLHSNLIGLILCKVPDGSVPFGGGTGGAEYSAINWKVNNNLSENNFWGYMAIDGANNNILSNNQASNNLVTDIELCFETNFLFGFFTPTSFENKVNLGGNAIEVIDCGVDNVVNGGTPLNGPCSL